MSRAAIDVDSAAQSPAVAPALLGDIRFRALLGPEDWAALPEPVRRRFSKRLGAGATAVYIGRVTQVSISRLGFLLAQVLRIIGAPLPLSRDIGTASVVTVTEDGQTQGQNWTRLYARANGFPQVIQSEKRFSGPTGLEEHVGYGIAMSLSVHVEAGALVFRAKDYLICMFGRRVVLPGWLTPGNLTVRHAATTETAFLFTLDLRHPVFGCLVHQEALFESEVL